jgi:hypothetical protein
MQMVWAVGASIIAGMLLAQGGAGADVDAPKPEWGALWEGRLPAQEHHPSLLYGEAERALMRARLGQEPWRGWVEGQGESGPLVMRALRWWLLGDEAAAKVVRAALVEGPIWREATHGYLEPSSHSLAMYVMTYDVIAAWPGLSAEDHRVIRDKIAAEADYYYDTMDSVPGGANYGNQRTLGASAMGMAALTLCEYRGGKHGPGKWLRRALHEIRRDENWWFFRPGGYFVEGLGYTSYMNTQFVPFAIAYARATGKYLFAEPRLREWLTFACYQLTGSGESVMWGTCESETGLTWMAPLCGKQYGRDLQPLFQTTFALAPGASPGHYFTHLALAYYEPGVNGTPPAASRFFPRSQHVVLRDDWGHDTVAVWFAGKDPSWPLRSRYGTYSQGDAGHFVLAGWDEVLATDSGYDHWHSQDYFGAQFHNVLLIDGKGPEQATGGEMTAAVTEGPVRRAQVTMHYGGCTVHRTLALVRGRYVVVVDRVVAQGEHAYAWQVRSQCPPGSEGTRLEGRSVTWPGLSATQWRDLVPGRTELTTVAPPFAALTLEAGRWRPMSGRDEFHNQVTVARWTGASTTALFVLIPNLRGAGDVRWETLGGQDVAVTGPGWRDEVRVEDGALVVQGDGGLEAKVRL